MVIYHYHPETGELLGTGGADENPLDAENPLVPAFATPTAPPAPGHGEVAVYRDADHRAPFNWPEGSWASVPDFREVPLFNTSDGSLYTLGEQFDGLGHLPPAVTALPRPSAAHVWGGQSWQLDEGLAASQHRSAALSERASRMDAARDAMDPLQFAADLGEATDAEVAELTAWKRYVVSLNRLDLSADPIVWPTPPST